MSRDAIMAFLGWKLTVEDFTLGVEPILLCMAVAASTLDIQFIGAMADQSMQVLEGRFSS